MESGAFMLKRPEDFLNEAKSIYERLEDIDTGIRVFPRALKGILAFSLGKLDDASKEAASIDSMYKRVKKLKTNTAYERANHGELLITYDEVKTLDNACFGSLLARLNEKERALIIYKSINCVIGKDVDSYYTEGININKMSRIDYRTGLAEQMAVLDLCDSLDEDEDADDLFDLIERSRSALGKRCSLKTGTTLYWTPTTFATVDIYENAMMAIEYIKRGSIEKALPIIKGIESCFRKDGETNIYVNEFYPRREPEKAFISRYTDNAALGILFAVLAFNQKI